MPRLDEYRDGALVDANAAMPRLDEHRDGALVDDGLVDG